MVAKHAANRVPEAESNHPKSTHEWNWHPVLPIKGSPLFEWPPRAVQASRHLVQGTFFSVERLGFLTLATLTWLFLCDGLADGVLRLGFMVQTYLVNLILMVLVAMLVLGLLHQLHNYM